jgi:hypothetical protein
MTQPRRYRSRTNMTEYYPMISKQRNRQMIDWVESFSAADERGIGIPTAFASFRR